LSVLEFVYKEVLRPKPLKLAVNQILLALIPRQISRHGAKIVLNPRDPIISGALTLRVYERAETKFFLRAFRPGMSFLDIGANVGYYTALALARRASLAIAMEPFPESFAHLQKTVAANSLGDVAHCVNRAAADRSGSATLFLNESNKGDNRLYPNDLCTTSVTVETVAVDDQLAEMGHPRIDFVKIDVQGFEGKTLAGMRHLLADSRDLLIMTEFWPHGLRAAGDDPRGVLDSLAGLGFALYELGARGRTIPLLDNADLIKRLPGREYTNIVAIKGSSGTLGAAAI
jgi:FkbM family methyltransferase